jgi:hypothetical protein
MARRHEDSSRGRGWQIADAGARVRYQGTGLDHVVVGKVTEILARSGMVIEKEK